MNVRIRNNLRKQRSATAAVEKKIRKLLRSLELERAELSVLFLGDRAMRTLNRKYRGKDATTDVLSFPMRGERFSHIQPDVLGDIVISIPAAQRQAGEAGHSLAREIDILLVHGLLHLLGYDHEQGEAQAKRMERRERQLLKRLSS